MNVLRVLVVIALIVGVGCTSQKKTDTEPASSPTLDSASAKKADKNINEDGVDTTQFNVNDTMITLKNDAFPQMGGRVVNVMVTGVDSRLGDPMGHADANHLVRFFLDSGCIEIISIPRDTPFDAGFEDSTGLNKLTNVRANRGRQAYLKAVTEITGCQRIEYYIEFGFSQAIGLLELLGYKDNAASTLRVLRSRQAYRSGDFQRSYNQGQFIRQAVLKHFDKTDDIVGDIALRAALALVETNLSYDACQQIFEAMRAKGFPRDPSNVWVRLKPSVIAKFTMYDFSAENVNEINREIDYKIHRLGLDSIAVTSETYERRLSNLVNKAAADSAKTPGSVVRLLRRAYEQRAWMQVSDRQKRMAYRDRMCGMLIVSYDRMKNTQASQQIRSYLEIENKAASASK